jgi:hypothetical protein
VLLIAGCALALAVLAVLACAAIDSPDPIGEAAVALAGAPFPIADPSALPRDMFPLTWQGSSSLKTPMIA